MKFISGILASFSLLICTESFSLINTYSVEIPNKPRNFIISKNESFAYVVTGTDEPGTCSSQNSDLVKIDIKNLKMIGKFNASKCLGNSLFLSKDEKSIYINDGDKITIINTDNFKIIKDINIPKDDFLNSSVLMSPDKNRLYYSIFSPFGNPKYREYFLVIDTNSNEIVDKIPNSEAICHDGCFPVAGNVMSQNGNEIYEMPDPSYRKPQPLFLLNVYNHSTKLWATFNSSLVNNSLFLGKDDKTFYSAVSKKENPISDLPADWYINSFDKETLKEKELYHTEHKIALIGISEDNHQLYVLHLREYHKGITMIDSFTGKELKNIPMSNYVSAGLIKVTSIANESTIYFATPPGAGHKSLFNVVKF